MKVEYDEKKLNIIRVKVVLAFNKLKHHKSPGLDRILSEILIAFGDTAVYIFHKIYHSIWEDDTRSED